MEAQPTSVTPALPRKQIGPWKLNELLTEGAATSVYRVLSSRGEDGALKLFHDKTDRGRLAHHEQAALKLSHPNLPEFLDHGVTPEGRSFVVTRFIPGPTLEALLNQTGALSPRDAVTLCERVSSALSVCHAQGILHRDLKPSNIILPDATGITGVTLLDFSLSGQLDSESNQTLAGQFVGTPNYMSPEQLQSQPHTRATDVWGLGVLLYELLFGHPPFQRPTVADTVYAIVGKSPEFDFELPPELDELLARCLAKNPTDRFQDAGQVQEALDHWLEERTPFPEAEAPQGVAMEFDALPAPAPIAFPEALPDIFSSSLRAPAPCASFPEPMAPPPRTQSAVKGGMWALLLVGIFGIAGLGTLTALWLSPRAEAPHPTSQVPTPDKRTNAGGPKPPPTPSPVAPPPPIPTLDTSGAGLSKPSPVAPPTPAPLVDTGGTPAPPPSPVAPTPPDLRPPTATQSSSPPPWAFGIPVLVALLLGLGVRTMAGKKEPTSSHLPSLGGLAADQRRDLLSTNLGSAVNEMITRCQDDAPANFMALSLALTMEDYGNQHRPEDKAATLEQTIKLLELLDKRLPTTLTPWYVQHNALLALVVSVLGLLVTLFGLLPGGTK